MALTAGVFTALFQRSYPSQLSEPQQTMPILHFVEDRFSCSLPMMIFAFKVLPPFTIDWSITNAQVSVF